MPLSHSTVTGEVKKSFDLGNNDSTNTKTYWKTNRNWNSNPVVINGTGYKVSIQWTNNKPIMTFTEDKEATKAFKDNAEKKLQEKNTAFVTKNKKQLTDCTTGDICTDTQKPLVVAAIAEDAPIAAVKALQKEMKRPETGVWDEDLLNALMQQKK